MLMFTAVSVYDALVGPKWILQCIKYKLGFCGLRLGLGCHFRQQISWRSRSSPNFLGICCLCYSILHLWTQKHFEINYHDHLINRHNRLDIGTILYYYYYCSQACQFSIIVDGTQDASGKEQLFMCLHYVDSEFVPQEQFVGLYEPPNTNTNHCWMYQVCVSSSKLASVPFAWADLRRCYE